MKLYSAKLAEYSIYVNKYVTEKKSGVLDYPPSRPTYLRDTFVQNLAALNAHQLPTVVMDDGEYSSILSGIQRLQQSINTCTANIASVSYT